MILCAAQNANFASSCDFLCSISVLVQQNGFTRKVCKEDFDLLPLLPLLVSICTGKVTPDIV
jgi:hypothetical protein